MEGQARNGVAGPGNAWRDAAWLGRRGVAWDGTVRQVLARPGRRGRHGVAGHGSAGRGWAWQAWHGSDGLGMPRPDRAGLAGHGAARRGTARPGSAGLEWLVMARYGPGMAGMDSAVNGFRLTPFRATNRNAPRQTGRSCDWINCCSGERTRGELHPPFNAHPGTEQGSAYHDHQPIHETDPRGCAIGR